MIIYEVRNKVCSYLFESREDADTFMSFHASAANGLNVYEVEVIDDSKKLVKEKV